MIDDLDTWKSTWAAIPNVGTGSWAQNVAYWCGDRVTGKAELDDITNLSVTFTFDRDTFKSQLAILSPSDDKTVAVGRIADAWGASILVSTLNIVSGAYKGIPLPTTTWSVISSSKITSDSIAAGKVIINGLVSDPLVTNPVDSYFPVRMRQAFLALKGDVKGLDSSAPPVVFDVLNVAFI